MAKAHLLRHGGFSYSLNLNDADGDLMHLNVIDDLANLIFMGAYWVKDILWLRLLAIVGSLTVIPFYLLQTEPLWTPTMWSCLFISIHATRAWGIVKEGRPPPAQAGESNSGVARPVSSPKARQYRALCRNFPDHRHDPIRQQSMRCTRPEHNRLRQGRR
jgi:hypothetical protein